mgnify:FL=1
MPSADRLDHTVINVKFDMDAATALFGKLGFTLTPRGYHSHGSMNHLMMFDTDYLELIGIPEGKEIERKDLQNAPIGINGIVFKALDVDGIYARLQNAKFDGEPPKAFHRPVDIAGGQKDAKFRTVTVRDDVFPGGRVYYCEHGTPELVWRHEWQSHENGVTSMPEFVAVASDADGEAAKFATILDTYPEMDGNGIRYVTLDGCRITVLTSDQYSNRYGELASIMGSRNAIFGAIVFATASLSILNGLLGDLDGVATKLHSDRTIVRVDAFDTVLEFVDVV